MEENADGGAAAERPSSRSSPIPKPRALTPVQVSRLRILDPACGSGSFLIGAYQYLLDWHCDWYVNHDPARWTKGGKPALVQTRGGYRLTIDERKRILLNNIYGVDIDSQAVEVTKLSLLLKVLEGETGQSLEPLFRIFHQRALPDLGANIKCGNSLIGPDFYRQAELPLLTDEEKYRINVFDWETEFPEVFKVDAMPSSRSTRSGGGAASTSGGFDVVIGNPPYVRQEGLGTAKTYYQSHYNTFRPTADLYVNFIEKGLGLLKPTGLFGMIVSNKWLRAAYGQPLREFLTNNASVFEMVDFAGLPVFAGTTVRTIILICSPTPKQNDIIHYLAPVPLEDFRTIHSGERLEELASQRSVNLLVSGLSPDGWSLSPSGVQQLLHRAIQNAIPLHQYVAGKLFRGVVTGMNKAFIIDYATRSQLVAEDRKSVEIIKPVLAGRDIKRYSACFNNRYIIFTRRGINMNNYPAVLNYLSQFRKELTPKKTGEEQYGRKPGRYEWYEIQDTIDYYMEFAKPKIIYPDIATTCRFVLDRNSYFGTNTTYFMPTEDLYLLGVLNSQLARFYFSQVCAGLESSGTTYLRFFGQYLEGFPVRPIDLSNPADRVAHDRMVALVEQMLEMHKKLAAAKTPHEKTALERQISATDTQIDRLVYDLYGLTEEEIKIVKGVE